MKAVKNNKEYTISETEKSSYLAQGYDILGDDGKIIERSAQSTVSRAEYEAVVKENTALRAKLAESSGGEKENSDVPEA